MTIASGPPLHLIAQLVELLVSANYAQVLLCAPNSYMSASDLEAAVTGYGRHLVSPPHYDLVDVIAITAASQAAWSVVVPLFTQEEGRSDLSLELTISESDHGGHEVEVDALHVR